METLTKENFWNEMEQKYPKAMKHFQNWIDEYKGAGNGYYYALFNAGRTTYLGSDTKHPMKTVAPKYHELPIAMQFGIFIEWVYNIDILLNEDFYVSLHTGPKNNMINGKPVSLLSWCRYNWPQFFEYVEELL